MTLLILLTLALYFIHMLLPPTFDYVWQGKFVEALGARDTPPPVTLLGTRARRALTNMTENMLLFLPLAILAVALEKVSGLAITGASIFFLARATYLPLYILGVQIARSLCWLLGVFGLGPILLAIGS